jgi:membrane fusion protein (multidrug efflux system)
MILRACTGAELSGLRRLGISAAFVSVLAVGGCSQREQRAAPEPKPPTVSVTTAVARDIPVAYEFIGQTEATRRVEIRSRVPGFVLSREYAQGGAVKQGDVLFRLDRRPFEADLEVSKAELDEAKAALTAAESDVERFAELLAADAGSKKEYDDAVAARSAALAKIRAAEARIARSELELSYTVIDSPLTGVAGASKKDIGSYVDGSADSLLVEVIETDPMDVLFTVSEREIERTRRAEREGRLRPPESGKVQLELTLLDGSVYRHTGSISFADIQVDPVTGSTRVRGEFPNPERLLRPGQFVRGRVKGYVRPRAVTVPRRAIVQSPSGAVVLLVDPSNVAQPRPVTLGEWIESDVVVLSGLAEGDRIITDGLQRVAPGMKITVAASGPTEGSASGSTKPDRR